MSIWVRIGEFLSQVTTEAFSSVVDGVRTAFAGDPETRRQVGFSIAMIALSAKMAKADGIVTQDEVDAFREPFAIPDKEMNNVARLYNLAKQDVAGYHSYADRVKKLFPDDDAILVNVMDGLFHIAKADGLIHNNEMLFLDDVAGIFDLPEREYESIKSRHLEPEEGDPYLQLGAMKEWDKDQLKKHYRKLVVENHPDKLMAQGVPKEFLAIANDRLAGINRAWDVIKRERGI
ncbi:MAG: molecular chaperone DjiA [Rhizobiaceae bacterium]|nr:molecular chaperone DjiA [Rhizobiaceae bacterium]